MASLQDIMNVDEDQLDSHTNKKDQLPTSSSIYHQPYLAPSPTYNSGYATGGDQADSSVTKKRSPPTRITKSSTGSSSSSGRPSTSRRRSNVSPENMDPSQYGYGYGGPSGGHDPSGAPSRPFSNTPPGSDMPVKLTPITGRVSRAKKGMKVHTCDICRPPKVSYVLDQLSAHSDFDQTFTRAEHLR